MSDPGRLARIGGTEREERAGYRSGLDDAVARFVASATAAAAEVKPRNHRWVLLMLFAEAHQRAAAAIKALAQQEAGHG
jgi:hypothetical protein